MVYAAGIAISLFRAPNQPLLVFGGISVIGVLGGVLTIRGMPRWRAWVLVAAISFLGLSLLRHIGFFTTFLTDYPSALAALNQYIVESRFAISGAIERRAFLPLFMYPYHEWVMPVIQITIVVLILKGRLNLRSNPGLNTDAVRPQRAG